MPTQPINIITEDASQEDIINEIAKFQKIVRYLLNGGLDTENVNELNASVINAGIVNANLVTIKGEDGTVYYQIDTNGIVANNGSENTLHFDLATGVLTLLGVILQSSSSAEKVKIDSTGFHAYDASGVERITIGTTPVKGAKAIIGRDSAGAEQSAYTYDTETVDGAIRTGQYVTAHGAYILIDSSGEIRLQCHPVNGEGFRARRLARPEINDGGGWSPIAKASVNTSDHVQPNHNHGIPHGTVFTDKSGVDHTWNESGGFTHSHTQN